MLFTGRSFNIEQDIVIDAFEKIGDENNDKSNLD